MDIRRYFAPKSAGGKQELRSSLQDQKKVPTTPENPVRRSPRNKPTTQHNSSSSSEKKVTRCTARRVISSDEESDSEDPIPSKVAKRLGKLNPATGGRTAKTFKRISSDEDSDVETSRTKSPAGRPVKNVKKTPPKKKPAPTKAKKKEEPKKVLNRIAAADFFGSATVKAREKKEGKKVLEEKDGKKEKSPGKKKETERHGNADFDSLLEEIDSKTKSAGKDSPPIEIEEYEDSGSGESWKNKRKREKSVTPEIVVSDDEDFQPISNKRQKETTSSLKKTPAPSSAKKIKSPVVEIIKQKDFGKTQPHSVTPKSASVVVTPSQKVTPSARKKVPLELTTSPVRRSPRKSQSLAAPVESKNDKKEKQVEKIDAESSKTPTVQKSVTTPGSLDKSRRSHGGGPGYRSYLNREGPQALGTKEIPEGAENCLKGKTFVITGVLDSIEREDAGALIEKHGGKVMSSVSKKTSFVVVGRDAGQSKMDKVDKFKLKTLDEDGLFDLIRKSKPQAVPKRSPVKAAQTSPEDKDKPCTSKSAVEKQKTGSDEVKILQEIKSGPGLGAERGGELSWVDKYKPTSVSQLIGQNGAKSPVNKLIHWLKNWGKWHLGQGTAKKANIPPWKCEDGSVFKAALLSGTPGIGKTSSAVLVCEVGRVYWRLLATVPQGRSWIV